MFEPGREYTRREIHAQLGGSTVSCLPTNGGVVVAACLAPAFSPRAPAVVLCGQGVRTGPVSALFARQREALPVFVKSAANRWQYRGRFVVDRSLRAGREFERFVAGSGRSPASVSQVVLLKPAD